MSHYKKLFHELNQSNIQFPMNIKDIPIFERLNKLNTNVFELSANDKTHSPKFVYENKYAELIVLLLYENHYCLISHLQFFVGIMNTINTYAQDA